ncbi:hypothetical protein B0T17DRAFT_184452 [Bombardia bombarda]|uniref:Uncharacterized protein n=1 Tax=Bombardia bombarda TaxID=252184 RepID=A0AA39X9U9_9PEZI|nr:hypothetical protein B0T17DRAFT_184452 [Bombardia bombarda]
MVLEPVSPIIFILSDPEIKPIALPSPLPAEHPREKTRKNGRPCGWNLDRIMASSAITPPAPLNNDAFRASEAPLLFPRRPSESRARLPSSESVSLFLRSPHTREPPRQSRRKFYPIPHKQQLNRVTRCSMRNTLRKGAGTCNP